MLYTDTVFAYVERAVGQAQGAVSALKAASLDRLQEVGNISFAPPPQPLRGVWERLPVKTVAAVAVLAAAGGTWHVWRQQQPRRRRHAARASNGSRLQAVLVVGLITDPLTRLVALDLERRGFLVYLTLLSPHETAFAENNGYTDFVYLDTTTGPTPQLLANLAARLQTPVVPFPGAAPHTVRLKGVVVVPGAGACAAPVEATPAAEWSRALARLSLVTELLGAGLVPLLRACGSEPAVVLVLPVVVPALHLPFHACENVLHAAASALFTTLAKEVAPQGIRVVQLHVGSLALSPQRASHHRVATAASRTVALWDGPTQERYGERFGAVAQRAGSSGAGSPVRLLYHAVYDALAAGSGLVYVGRGARLYAWVGLVW